MFAILWRVMEAKGVKMRPTDKMMIGFVLTTLTMIVHAAAGFYTDGGAKVSVLWQAGAYLLLTMAEICISVVGLELAFAAAPKNMKSFVTACWLLCVALGNLFFFAPITSLSDILY